ncbi:MAG: LLM class flavin-dependent oxidoreductase, partial [Deltaproteobacteria bacterium]|nr:LLM class flavin-dependent oxidoreductase [Deltaproteobacteria bacterium]
MAKLALGIALAGPGGGWQRALRVVAQAEALGLHSVWLPEGHFERGATPSPLLALCAFAARTQRLRLATTSLLLPLHDPLRVAAEAATLDALSGGRLLLGLGRGFRPRTFAAFQVSAAEKRDRFDAALDAILAAWPAAAAQASGGA